MREIELKGVATDAAAMEQRLMAAGASLQFRGSLADRRYDTPDRRLRMRDEILRVRSAMRDGVTASRLEFKSAARYPGGLKERDEIGTEVTDLAATEAVLRALGLEVSLAIEREIVVYRMGQATVRFERYPRMDVLVEVEGEPGDIEAAIAALGAPRSAFTSERLADFVMRFEARTGVPAALCRADLEALAAHPRPWSDA